MNTPALSIVLPARNEAESLQMLLPRIRGLQPNAEILVVDDGSVDHTAEVCAAAGVRTIRQPYSMGNGAAIKAGARSANGDVLVMMDADGQHRPEDIDRLLERLNQGFDMVVGARTTRSQASLARLAGNALYNRLASWIVGHKIADLTSGFRAVRADRFREFLHLLPNGFSYPTTITMAFFRAGYAVSYEEIQALRRIGSSHIRLFRDAVRFLLIIFKIGTLYSPLKIFLPISLGFLALGVAHYLHTYLETGRFTNMAALLLVTSVLVFLIGLISEQITSLLYRQ